MLDQGKIAPAKLVNKGVVDKEAEEEPQPMEKILDDGPAETTGRVKNVANLP